MSRSVFIEITMDRRYFKVLTDLTHFFLDHRCACYTLVNVDRMKTIDDLKSHISKVFKISEFYLQFEQHYLPETEDIRILAEGDIVRAIKLPNTAASNELVGMVTKDPNAQLRRPEDAFLPRANSTLQGHKHLNTSQEFLEKIHYFEKLDHKNYDDSIDSSNNMSISRGGSEYRKFIKILDRQLNKPPPRDVLNHGKRFKVQCTLDKMNSFAETPPSRSKCTAVPSTSFRIRNAHSVSTLDISKGIGGKNGTKIDLTESKTLNQIVLDDKFKFF